MVAAAFVASLPRDGCPSVCHRDVRWVAPRRNLKGQVGVPQGVLRQLGIAPIPLLVETTEDGAIVLRQVSVHPIEIYSDGRGRIRAR